MQSGAMAHLCLRIMMSIGLSFCPDWVERLHVPWSASIGMSKESPSNAMLAPTACAGELSA